MGDLVKSSTRLTAPSRQLPYREDCWTEEATATLVDAWGRRLSRGILRQNEWQEVADAVNARHGHSKRAWRTDVQCKNRIDTLKKKYKVENAKISKSNGTLTSSWPFFDRLDALIGSTATAKKLPPPSSSPPLGVPLPYMKPVALPRKRASPAVDDSFFRRNYSAVAAAAAAAPAQEEGEDGLENSSSSEEIGGQREMEVEEMRRLARAIERLGEIYERVEGGKQRQMIELEKQRIQFAKDLEVQKVELFMDIQVHLGKIKQAKGSGSNGERSQPLLID